MEPLFRSMRKDQFLTNISVAAMNEPSAYVALQAFPSVKVNNISDAIAKYDTYAWLEDVAQYRAPATESEGSGWTVSEDSYVCRNLAFHKDVSIEQRRNVAAPFELDRTATLYTVDRILMGVETRFASNFFLPGPWGANTVDLSGAGIDWVDPASIVIKQIEDAKIAISDVITREPSTLIVGRHVHSGLLQNPQILARVANTRDQIITEETIRLFLGVDKYLVGRALKATSKKGAALTTARILGKHALLLYVPSSPSLMTPAAGYTFLWSPFGPANPIFTRRFFLQRTLSDRVESHIYYDMKLLSAAAGYFFENAVP